MVEKEIVKKHYKDHQYKQRLFFVSCVLIDGKMYSVTNLGKIPIRVDIKKQEITCIDRWDKENAINPAIMIADNDDIYLFETEGYHMVKYNIFNNQYHKFKIDCHTYDWGNYVACVKYKKNIYIFPKYMSKIVKVDIEKNIVISDLIYYLDSKKEEINFECGIQDNNLLWLFQKEGNIVMAYDMETNTWKNYALPQKVKFCAHVVLRKGIFYILSMEGRVYSWDIQANSMRMIGDCSHKIKGTNSFGRIVVTDGIIYLLPAFSELIYKIDVETGEAEVFNDYPKDFQYIEPEGWGRYSGYCEDEEFYYFAMCSSAYILCINKKSGLIKWICPQISRENYFNAQIKYSGIVFEKDRWNVKDLIDIKTSLIKGDEKLDLVRKQIWGRLKK